MDHRVTTKRLVLFSILLLLLALRRPSMDKPLRLRAPNKSRLCKRSWTPYRVRWPMCKVSYNGSPAALLRPLTSPRTSQSAIAAVQQDEKSKVEAELTPKTIELGKATVTYRIFSQDPFAAPRINNEPLDPRFPGYFRLPGTSTLLRIGGYAKTDFIYDLKPAGNVDSFIPATIPIPSLTSINNSTISVRATRLNLDFLVPTKSGDSYGSSLKWTSSVPTQPRQSCVMHTARRRTSWSAKPSRISWILTPGRIPWTTRGQTPWSLSVTRSSATACLWQRRPPSASRPRSRLRTYFL